MRVLYADARDRLNEIVSLQQLGATLLQEHDFDRLLHAIGEQLLTLTDAEGVALALLDEHEQIFEVRGAVGVNAAGIMGQRVPAEGSFVGEAVRTNHQVAPPTTRDLSPAASDLARLLAGIIVALAMEPAHAHG